jgi:hypothetical protein
MRGYPTNTILEELITLALELNAWGELQTTRILMRAA